MATGFKTSSGVDLDTIFAARISAAGTNTGFTNSAGVDLAQLFEPGQLTVHPTDTGFRNSAGTDLRNLFSTSAGPAPTNFTGTGYFSRASGTATVTATFKNDGTCTFVTNLGGSAGTTKNYLTPTTAAAGNNYDLEIVKSGVSGVGTAGGIASGANVWYQINVDRAVSLTCSGSSGAPNTANQTITWRIRRRSDNAVVCNGTIDLTVESGI